VAPGAFAASYGDVAVRDATDITVYVTRDDAALDAYVSSLASQQEVHVSYVTVPYSHQQLNGLIDRVVGNQTALAAQGVRITALIPDVPDGTIDVILETPSATTPAASAADTSAAAGPTASQANAEAALTGLYGSGRFTVESYTAEPGTPLDSFCTDGCRMDDYPSFYGGDSITSPAGHGCSSGFAVREPSGAPAVLTAGHCATPGTVEYVNCFFGTQACPASADCPRSGPPAYCPVRELGTVGTYQSPTSGDPYDFEAIDMPSGESSTYYVYGGAANSRTPPIYTVTGYEAKPSGACCLTVDGAVTGETRYNYVYNDDTAYNYGYGLVANLGMVYNSTDQYEEICSDGDSGGPVYEHVGSGSSVLANGTIVASGPNFQLPNTNPPVYVYACFFQEMYEVLGGLGLTLVAA
jgi:hypothetical protein